MSDELDNHVPLLSRVRDRADGRAFEELASRYRSLVVGHVRKAGLDETRAETLHLTVMRWLAEELRAFRFVPERGRLRDHLELLVRDALGSHTAPSAEDFLHSWVHHHCRLALAVVGRHLAPEDAAWLTCHVANPSSVNPRDPVARRVRDQLLAQIARQIREEQSPDELSHSRRMVHPSDLAAFGFVFHRDECDWLTMLAQATEGEPSPGVGPGGEPSTFRRWISAAGLATAVVVAFWALGFTKSAPDRVLALETPIAPTLVSTENPSNPHTPMGAAPATRFASSIDKPSTDGDPPIVTTFDRVLAAVLDDGGPWAAETALLHFMARLIEKTVPAPDDVVDPGHQSVHLANLAGEAARQPVDLPHVIDPVIAMVSLGSRRR